MRPFRWKKLGIVCSPNIQGFTHSSHPCITHINDSQFLLAFTCRDKLNKSHIFLSQAAFNGTNLILTSTPKMALAPGPLGFFDSDGAISVCFVTYKDTIYLYYVGWQNLPHGMWICDTGRVIAHSDTLTLHREFPGPVLARDKQNPLFAAGTAFLIIDDVWHTWYNSGIKWEQTSNGLKHYYGIHHATSKNGIDWIFEPGMVIPFADEYEYAFGRPSVILIDDVFCMWFAHRASKNIEKYRMGFAYSYDAVTWIRADDRAGIDVSPEGWDSEMICYPYVFQNKGDTYMLYNGNDYGRTGFGLAILESD